MRRRFCEEAELFVAQSEAQRRASAAHNRGFVSGVLWTLFLAIAVQILASLLRGAA